MIFLPYSFTIPDDLANDFLTIALKAYVISLSLLFLGFFFGKPTLFGLTHRPMLLVHLQHSSIALSSCIALVPSSSCPSLILHPSRILLVWLSQN
jgi:hypothetical protein